MSARAESASPRRGWIRWAPGAVVFVIATVVALVCAGSVSLWTDEAVSISAARRDWADLGRLLSRIDAVHGVYYALLKVWIGLFGPSALAVRSLSALIIGFAALGVYVLVRRHASAGTALTAGLVAAVLPRLTWAGIEARPFALSALMAVWATVAFSVAVTRSRASSWIVYAVVAAAGVYANIYLALLVAGHGVTVLLVRRREGRTWTGYLVAAAAAAIASVPLLLLVRSQQSQLGTEGDRSPLSILRKLIVNQYFLGETPSLNPQSFLGALPTEEVEPHWFELAWQAGGLIAAAIGILFILIAVIRPARAGDDKRMLLAIALPWAVLPAVLIAAYSVLVSPLYHPRYFTFAAPAVAVLVALGVRAVARAWWARALVVVFVLSCAIVVASQRIPFAKSGTDWAVAAETVAAGAQPGDAVYFTPNRESDEASQYTARRIAAGYPAAFADLYDLTADGTGAETATFDGVSLPLDETADRLEGYDRLWVVAMRSTDPDILAEDRAFLQEQGFTGTTLWTGPGSTVSLYERR